MINNQVVKDDVEISEEFNRFFSTVGKKISNSIPPTDVKPTIYIKNATETNLKFDDVTGGEVLAVMRSMVPKSSADIFGFSTKLINHIATAICHPLAYIFNISLKTGIFPNKLKTSRVIPIFKNGDRRECNNYRPISLVSSFANVIEKIVSIKLKNYLELNKLLTTNQFGFQNKLSTEHNLIHLTQYVASALNDNKFAIGIFLDLQKAFDVVNHEILLVKLSNLGIKNTELNWFQSYLTGRRQCVDINGQFSSLAPIDISVMQGSILGPLLFLCFINDLPNTTEILRLLLFADDTCALDSDNNLTTLINRCNEELQKLANWFVINKI